MFIGAEREGGGPAEGGDVGHAAVGRGARSLAPILADPRWRSFEVGCPLSRGVFMQRTVQYRMMPISPPFSLGPSGTRVAQYCTTVVLSTPRLHDHMTGAKPTMQRPVRASAVASPSLQVASLTTDLRRRSLLALSHHHHPHGRPENTASGRIAKPTPLPHRP